MHASAADLDILMVCIIKHVTVYVVFNTQANAVKFSILANHDLSLSSNDSPPTTESNCHPRYSVAFFVYQP